MKKIITFISSQKAEKHIRKLQNLTQTLQKGNFDERRAFCQKLLGQLLQAYQAQNYTDCTKIAALAKSLKTPLENLDLLRGLTFLQLGDIPSARESLKEELRHFPENKQATDMIDKIPPQHKTYQFTLHKILSNYIQKLLHTPCFLQAVCSACTRTRKKSVSVGLREILWNVAWLEVAQADCWPRYSSERIHKIQSASFFVATALKVCRQPRNMIPTRGSTRKIPVGAMAPAPRRSQA